MDIKKAVDEFIKYSKNYDLSNSNIKRKQDHSIRVMEISKKIAIEKNLSENDIYIATLIGLLHDIARFDQYTKYKTFHDKLSFDHGDYGAMILDKDIRKYIENDKYDQIIKISVKNHNKYEIENKNTLDKKTLMFAEIIRDADKIDIIYEWIGVFYNGEEKIVENATISDVLFNEFKKKKLIKRVNSENYTAVENIITTIAFIFDLNFKESFMILKECNYINKIMDRFNFKNKDTLNKMKEITRIANKYINDRITK